MKIILLLILFLLLLIFIRPYVQNYKENMTDLSQNPDTKNPIQLITDDFFSNVIFYPNDDTDDFFKQKLGINKCMEDPKIEQCVEFGVTGTAFGWPKQPQP